jgi:hypothetical protein
MSLAFPYPARWQAWRFQRAIPDVEEDGNDDDDDEGSGVPPQRLKGRENN